MNKILQILSLSLKNQIEMIIHLGSGMIDNLSEYHPLIPKELILIDGDPEIIKSEILNFSEGACRHITALITPNGGETIFYRYNLPLLNGTLSIGKIETLYPRAKEIEKLELPSVKFSEILEKLNLKEECDRLLIIDVPGQEKNILASLSKEELLPFRWIVIRGCSEAFQEGASLINKSLSFLEDGSFEIIASDYDSDPSWPIFLCRFNYNLKEFRLKLENRERLLIEKSTENHRQIEKISELEKVLQERTEEIEGTQIELENRARLLIEKSTENHRQVEKISELEKVLQERTEEIEGTQIELENRARLLIEKSTENHRQVEKISELEKMLQERTEEVIFEKDQIISIEAKLSSEKLLFEVLSKGRIQQDRFYEESSLECDRLRLEISGLQKSVEEKNMTIRDMQMQGHLIDAEFKKAEGQIDMIKEIFLRE